MAAMGGPPGQERFVGYRRAAPPPRCPWCADPNADEWSDRLCIDHGAEYEGLSVSEMDRRDREQYAEYRDAHS